MSHVHNQTGQHDFTASAFIIRTDTPEPTVMLHIHRRYQRYMQFGGHVELDEHPWRAVLRELREESGYSPAQLEVLQPSGALTQQFVGAVTHPLPYYFNTHQIQGQAHFHSDLSYAMITAEPPEHVIGDGESADIGCYTLTDIKDLRDDQIYKLTRDSAIFLLEHLMYDWKPVPATHWPA